MIPSQSLLLPILFSCIITPIFGSDMNIGTLNFSPMLSCEIGKTATLQQIIDASLTSSETSDLPFTGYDINVLTRIHRNAGSDLTTIKLTCYNSETEILSALDSGNISYAIGGLRITSEKLELGYTFSIPLYTGGLKLAVAAAPTESIWAFFDPFHWSLWITIFATTLLVATITWIFEDKHAISYIFPSRVAQKSQHQQPSDLFNHLPANNQLHFQSSQLANSQPYPNVNAPGQNNNNNNNGSQQSLSSETNNNNPHAYCAANALEMIWQSFSSLFFASSIRLQTFSARIVFLGFWFLVVIISVTYVSNQTTILSAKRHEQTAVYSRFSDLRAAEEATVFTFNEYKSIYDQIYSSKTYSNQFRTFENSKSGLEKLINAFLSEESSKKAILLDLLEVTYFHSMYPCSTVVLFETIASFNYGILSKGESVMEDSINPYLYSFIDDPYRVNAISTYSHAQPVEHSCFFVVQNLSMGSLAGLWILLAAAVVAAILIEFAIHLKRKNRIRQMQRTTSSRSRSPSNAANERIKMKIENYLSNAQTTGQVASSKILGFDKINTNNLAAGTATGAAAPIGINTNTGGDSNSTEKKNEKKSDTGNGNITHAQNGHNNNSSDQQQQQQQHHQSFSQAIAQHSVMPLAGSAGIELSGFGKNEIRKRELINNNNEQSQFLTNQSNYLNVSTHNNNNNNHVNENELQEIESDFLLVSDYIHIPSKDVHLLAKEEIESQIHMIATMMKNRFSYIESNIVKIMKKPSHKLQTGKTQHFI